VKTKPRLWLRCRRVCRCPHGKVCHIGDIGILREITLPRHRAGGYGPSPSSSPRKLRRNTMEARLQMGSASLITRRLRAPHPSERQGVRRFCPGGLGTRTQKSRGSEPIFDRNPACCLGISGTRAHARIRTRTSAWACLPHSRICAHAQRTRTVVFPLSTHARPPRPSDSLTWHRVWPFAHLLAVMPPVHGAGLWRGSDGRLRLEASPESRTRLVALCKGGAMGRGLTSWQPVSETDWRQSGTPADRRQRFGELRRSW
jgi:hypothetical protein